MNYCNLDTGVIVSALPLSLRTSDGTINNPTLQQYAAAGWRRVVQIQDPPEGHRATSYTPEEINGTDARLLVATSVSIAVEAAAELAAKKADAKAILAGVGSTETGLALKAFAELVLQEINVLRQRESLTQYTWAQFVTALENKIDGQ